MKNIIYGLRDPRTDDYWYVGKSTQGMTRPRSHINQSHNEAVNEWISGLKEDNLLPLIDVLENCNNWSQLLDKEKFWIAKLLKEGHPLLNIYEAENIFSQREKIKELKNELKRKENLLRIKIEQIDQKIDEWKEREIFIEMENAGQIKKYVPKRFGKEVKCQRKKRKLSRNKFAKIAGLGKTVVFDIEHGKPTCRTETILRVAEALNIRLFFMIQNDL